MRGGGGIVPDVVIRQDTLTEAERQFARALGQGVPAYRDVLTSYALEVKGHGELKSPDFQVTPQMLRRCASV